MRKFLPLILCVGLTGCADPITNLVMGGATVATYSVLGKGPVDYALSEYKDQNCDIRNPKRYDGHYCIDRNQAMAPEAPLYCYRTLGSPDCSSQIDPHNNGAHPIVMPADRMIGSLPTSQLPVYNLDTNMPVSLTPATHATPPARPSQPPPLSPADNELKDEHSSVPIGS